MYIGNMIQLTPTAEQNAANATSDADCGFYLGVAAAFRMLWEAYKDGAEASITASARSLYGDTPYAKGMVTRYMKAHNARYAAYLADPIKAGDRSCPDCPQPRNILYPLY